MQGNFILESYLVTLFVPELQKIMLRKLSSLNGNCTKHKCIYFRASARDKKAFSGSCAQAETPLPIESGLAVLISELYLMLTVSRAIPCELPIKLQGVIPSKLSQGGQSRAGCELLQSPGCPLPRDHVSGWEVRPLCQHT